MIVCVFYHAYVGKSSVAYKEAKLKNLNTLAEAKVSEATNPTEQTENSEEIEEGEKVQIASEKKNNAGNETALAQKNEFGFTTQGGIDKESSEWKYRDYSTPHYVWFHLFMMLCSMYVVSIFTTWGYTRIDKGKWNFEQAETTMYVVKWVNISLFVLLYTWTVIAPRICKKREFVNKKMEYNF